MKKLTKPILKNASFIDKNNSSEISNEEAFQILRKGMIELFNNANNSQKDENLFYDMFNQIIQVAQDGYLPAQDYLGYLYKQGLGDLIPANYSLAMDWQFMAGSNGNEYTISRLKIFFTRSYDDILSMENAKEILNKNDIYMENFETAVGKLFCDAMVDSLGINIKDLVTRKPVYQASSIALTQKYEQARVSAIESVKNYLKKSVNMA